jgi:hypothetical protein
MFGVILHQQYAIENHKKPHLALLVLKIKQTDYIKCWQRLYNTPTLLVRK